VSSSEENQCPSDFGVRRSAFPEVRVSYSLKSRPATSRINGSRRSSEGHVAKDPEESGFGVAQGL
jgi:hypothetical protein